MKSLIIAGIVALVLLSSCVDENIWADELPTRHDLVRKDLKENYMLATEDYDLYGVMIISRYNDSLLIQCCDKYIESEKITEDVDLVIDRNQVWIYKTVYYPDGNVKRYRLEWLYHNTHSSSTMYYRHEAGYEHLNESLDTRSVAVYTSIDCSRPENQNLQRYWKEVDYEDVSLTIL